MRDDDRVFSVNPESLSELEERYLAILDSVQNGIIVVDRCGVLILVNRMAEHILGYPREEILGKLVADVFATTLLPGILATQKPLLGQKIKVHETVVMANYAPIFVDGKMFGAVSVFQDISLLENTALELSNVTSLSKRIRGHYQLFL